MGITIDVYQSIHEYTIHYIIKCPIILQILQLYRVKINLLKMFEELKKNRFSLNFRNILNISLYKMK